MPGETLIKIENLVMERRGKPVLAILDLVFRKDMTYALMGPNGAGKTTLLHLINRLEKPGGGTIRYEGINIFAQGDTGREIQRKMTLVMQPPLLFDSTVFDNIAYGLKARNLSRDEIVERVKRNLNHVGLAGYEKRKARKLSGGETQRVAIARALAIEPELLLLDEPTTFIDRANANFIEKLIIELRRNNNITIIFSTHNSRQAHRLADEVINLHNGRIWESDMVNLFRGAVDANETPPCFRSGALNIRLQDCNSDIGYIAVDPREIELSTEKPGDDRQCFYGKIQRIEDLDEVVLVTVNMGERIVAEIPKATFFKLDLALDKEVWVTLSENAVKTF